jgi:hypothetical protein
MKTALVLLLIAVAVPMRAAAPLNMTPRNITIVDRDSPPRVWSWAALVAYLRR